MGAQQASISHTMTESQALLARLLHSAVICSLPKEVSAVQPVIRAVLGVVRALRRMWLGSLFQVGQVEELLLVRGLIPVTELMGIRPRDLGPPRPSGVPVEVPSAGNSGYTAAPNTGSGGGGGGFWFSGLTGGQWIWGWCGWIRRSFDIRPVSSPQFSYTVGVGGSGGVGGTVGYPGGAGASGIIVIEEFYH